MKWSRQLAAKFADRQLAFLDAPVAGSRPQAEAAQLIYAAAIAELVGFVQSCGLDKDKAVEILGATPVCSPAAKGLASAMIAEKFSPLFPIELVEKDLGYLSATAAEQEAEVPVGQLARQVFQRAIAKGYGTDNITGVAQLYL